MTTARQRRGFAGVTRLRRKLRKMDSEITQDIKAEIKRGAQNIELDMVGGAPVDEGDLARSIAYKIGRDGFTAVIGPSADSAIIKNGLGPGETKFTRSGNLTAATIRNRDASFQLYKALWAEFGTKAGKAGSSSKPARPFIQPAFDVNKDRISKNIKAAVTKALRLAANG